MEHEDKRCQGTPIPATEQPLSRQEFIGVLEEFEKRTTQQYWERERRLSELASRVKLLEDARDREFSIEVQRRIRLTSGEPDPSCYGVEAGESLSSRCGGAKGCEESSSPSPVAVVGAGRRRADREHGLALSERPAVEESPVGALAGIWAYLREIVTNQRGIMKTITELTQEVNQAKADVETLRTTVHDGLERIDADVDNLNAMIEALRQQITDPAQQAELELAVANLRTTVSEVRSELGTEVQTVDDKTPDLPEPPPPPQE